MILLEWSATLLEDSVSLQVIPLFFSVLPLFIRFVQFPLLTNFYNKTYLIKTSIIFQVKSFITIYNCLKPLFFIKFVELSIYLWREPNIPCYVMFQDNSSHEKWILAYIQIERNMIALET